MGETALEVIVMRECLGVEDHRLECCQSTEDSSSDNYESDDEAFLCIGADTEEHREKAADKGLEGFRCLMDPQREELEGHLDDMISGGDEQTLLKDQGSKRVDGSDQESLGTPSNQEDTQIKVGKMSISSTKIKEAAGALSLQVVQNEVKIGNKVNQSKTCTSLTRRK